MVTTLKQLNSVQQHTCEDAMKLYRECYPKLKEQYQGVCSFEGTLEQRNNELSHAKIPTPSKQELDKELQEKLSTLRTYKQASFALEQVSVFFNQVHSFLTTMPQFVLSRNEFVMYSGREKDDIAKTAEEARKVIQEIQRIKGEIDAMKEKMQGHLIKCETLVGRFSALVSNDGKPLSAVTRIWHKTFGVTVPSTDAEGGEQ